MTELMTHDCFRIYVIDGGSVRFDLDVGRGRRIALGIGVMKEGLVGKEVVLSVLEDYGEQDSCVNNVSSF